MADYHNLLEDYLLQKIDVLEKEKIEKRIDPSLVIYADLSSEVGKDLRKALNKLFMQKKIVVQNSLNQKLIGINKDVQLSENKD